MWKTIKEFPMYEISPNGLIRNKTNQRIKKPSINSRGYPVVSLQRDGKQYLRTVHILLARAFIDNPRNCEQVNHIDGNKLNYDLSNLEWCTALENNLHARDNGLHISDGDKAVEQFTVDGRYVRQYKSISEASRQTGANRCAIGKVARGVSRYKTAGGFVWRYANG